MAELFGAPNGFGQAIEDQGHMLDNQGKQVGLDSARLELQTQQRMLSLMDQKFGNGANAPDTSLGGSFGQPKLPEMLDTMSEIALRSGRPQEADKYARSAGALRVGAAEVEKNHADAIIKFGNIIDSTLANVHDQQSFKQATMYLQSTVPQEFLGPNWGQLSQAPYSPDLIKQMSGAVQTKLQKAQTTAAEARAKVDTARSKEAEARVPLIEAQTKLAKARTENLGKTGTNKAPSASLKQAVNDAMEDYLKDSLKDNPQARVRRDRITEAAQDYVDQGYSPSQAAARAMTDAKEGGLLVGLQPSKGNLGSTKNPMKMPSAEPTDAQDGKLFRSSNPKYAGKLLQWNAKTKDFAIVEDPDKDAGGAGDPEEGDDGEEE